MIVKNKIPSGDTFPGNPRPLAFFIDLVLYLSVMFLIREVYFSSVSFMANGLFWSATTLAIATWRMRARGISWADLGLCNPASLKTTAIATLSILGMAIGFIIVFEALKEQLPLDLAPDTSNESATHKFGDLQNNWLLFFTIIPFMASYLPIPGARMMMPVTAGSSVSP